MVPTDDGATPAPIDRSVLERIRTRFAGSRPFESAELVEEGNLHLRVGVSDEYYPNHVKARIEIRWYRNDDFSLHYQEEHRDSVWQCRWDRHPNTHNSRSHFHPPPDASRENAEDAQWSTDHRDVCRRVVEYIEERIKILWEQD